MNLNSMTPEQIEHYNRAAEDGSIPDEKNPLFILSGTHTDLLVKIINHDINLVGLAAHELANRGLNREGKWVGFGKANETKKAVISRRKGKSKGL